MNDNLREFVREMVNSVMNLDITKFKDDTKFNEITEWDSFNNLMLISRFQDEMGVDFTALEIENTKTVKDLYLLIERKYKK